MADHGEQQVRLAFRRGQLREEPDDLRARRDAEGERLIARRDAARLVPRELPVPAADALPVIGVGHASGLGAVPRERAAVAPAYRC